MEAEDALVEASQAGDLKEVQALLSAGSDVNSRGKDGRTALVTVSWIGYLDIVKVLPSKGANVNLKSTDPGMAGGGRTPLIAASRQGHFKVAEVLLATGADVHETDGEGRDALMWASCGDYPRIARALVSKAASPPRKGYTALMLAKNVDMECLFFEAGADVNARAYSGNTALLQASFGDVDLVRALLDAGADTSIANDDGETALTIAGNDKIRALLKRAHA